jgi:hypothetical protein
MRKVKKIFYADIERVNQLTSKAVGIMEPKTKMKVRIRRNGSTLLVTNSPAVLELFRSKVFNFDDIEDKND